MEKELQAATSLAREAGRILLEYYRIDDVVHWKGVGDPVTAADRAANEFIVDELRKLFPRDGILAEESADDPARLACRRLWLIDPMDGTKQFIEHVGEFSVMIGLAVEGVPQVGVVFQPTEDRLYFAAPGIGAFVEEKWTTRRLAVVPVTDFSQMTIAVSRSHHYPVADRVCAALGVTSRVRSGSVGLKFGLIAAGQAHLYIHPGPKTNQWDTCAPEAILSAAGGLVTDTHGRPLQYNSPEIHNLDGIVASNGTRHVEIVEACSTAVRRNPGSEDSA